MNGEIGAALRERLLEFLHEETLPAQLRERRVRQPVAEHHHAAAPAATPAPERPVAAR